MARIPSFICRLIGSFKADHLASRGLLNCFASVVRVLIGLHANSCLSLAICRVPFANIRKASSR